MSCLLIAIPEIAAFVRAAGLASVGMVSASLTSVDLAAGQVSLASFVAGRALLVVSPGADLSYPVCHVTVC